MSNESDDGTGIYRMTMTLDAPAAFKEVRAFLQEQLGIDLVEYIKKDTEMLWLIPRSFVENFISDDLFNSDGTYEQATLLYCVEADLKRILGLESEPLDLDDIRAYREGECTICGKHEMTIIDHFVHGELVGSVCPSCYDKEHKKAKGLVDVTIQIPVALWNEYTKFCEAYEHELPADLIERTAVDSIRNSIDNAIDDGLYTAMNEDVLATPEKQEPSTISIAIKIPVQFRKLDKWLIKRGSSLNDVVQQIIGPEFVWSNLPERISTMLSKDGEDSDQYTNEIVKLLGWKKR